MDNGQPPSNQAVKQSGLADVRAANDGDGKAHYGLLFERQKAGQSPHDRITKASAQKAG
jgi:hypothetical protein